MQTLKSVPPRIMVMDTWRGLVFVTMFVFHFFAIFEYAGVINIGLYNYESIFLTEVILNLGVFTRYSFILISGFVGAYAFRGKLLGGESWWKGAVSVWRRVLMVGLMATLISALSFIFIPEAPVYFGILHYIAAVMFLVPFVCYKRYFPVVFFLIALYLRSFVGIEADLPDGLSIFLGLKVSFASIDYFAFLKWLPVSALAWVLSPWVMKIGERMNLSVSWLDWLGRRTLFLYFLHVAILGLMASVLVKLFF